MMLNRCYWILTLLLWRVVLGWPTAQGGPEEVVVVYNSSLKESKLVADHYVAARHIPTNQVFGFDLPAGIEISRADFKTKLQQPLADALATNHLWQFADVVVPAGKFVSQHTNHVVVASKIRYLLLCYGVPARIPEEPGAPEPAATNWQAPLRINTAAVDSELTWLPLARMHFPLFGPMVNWVHGATNEASLSPTNGILLVTRLDGPSPEIACGLVDKAMVAERDGLWGRAYFDLRGLATNHSYYYGDSVIGGAAVVASQLGFEMTVDTNNATFPASFPISQIALYCGWYDGDVSGPFNLPRVEFMPGAFAYHLHSFSAFQLRSSSNNWVGPLLAKGATCTMGCVSEPFLVFTPDVAFFMRAFAHGWTFGEAAWAGQPALSWQTTVVGDPLYCPFAKQPLVWFQELSSANRPNLDWAFLRLMDLDLLQGGAPLTVASAIDDQELTTHSAILNEKLADLDWQLGKPGAALDYYHRALKLHPTPMQSVRIRLAISEHLLAQNQVNEACDNYRRLLSETPDYAGRADIEARLQSLTHPTKPAQP